MYQRAFDRIKGSLNLFLRSGVIDGVFTFDESELTTKSFSKSFIDLIRQGGVLTLRQSSLIDVDTFIFSSDFKMHHLHFSSVMTAIQKWRFSNSPRFPPNQERLKTTFEKNSL